jgi:dipeptide/tripeptide permease
MFEYVWMFEQFWLLNDLLLYATILPAGTISNIWIEISECLNVLDVNANLRQSIRYHKVDVWVSCVMKNLCLKGLLEFWIFDWNLTESHMCLTVWPLILNPLTMWASSERLLNAFWIVLKCNVFWMCFEMFDSFLNFWITGKFQFNRLMPLEDIQVQVTDI